jgi:hypothetical protein
MFLMTCDIIIDKFKPIKPNAVKWSRSVENYSDSATIKVPSISALKKNGKTYERVQTGLQLKEGMAVEIYAGYDGENDLRFKGFIRRINFTVPLEIECEGYSYQLRKRLDFSKAYKNTTVKKILEDVCTGTDIKLSSDIPNIPLDKATFKNASGIQVIEWFKDKCLLTVYFNYDTLYVGALELEPKTTVDLRLGWNVIKDNDLKFNDNKEFADVRIEIGARNEQGERKREMAGNKDGQVKRFNTAIKDGATQKEIAKQKRNEILNRGYEGSVTCFLKPFIEPGMAVRIDDTKYPERKGRYFVSGVDGDFSTGGGRQKVKIGNTLGNG